MRQLSFSFVLICLLIIATYNFYKTTAHAKNTDNFVISNFTRDNKHHELIEVLSDGEFNTSTSDFISHSSSDTIQHIEDGNSYLKVTFSNWGTRIYSMHEYEWSDAVFANRAVLQVQARVAYAPSETTPIEVCIRVYYENSSIDETCQDVLGSQAEIFTIEQELALTESNEIHSVAFAMRLKGYGPFTLELDNAHLYLEIESDEAPDEDAIYDSFDSSNGPLSSNKWETYHAVNSSRLAVTQQQGRYHAHLKGDKDPQQTLWYNGAEGRLDYTTLTGDFEVIVRNMGIDSGSISGSYQLCGLMVWESPTNYETALAGNRGPTTNTIEYKTTNNAYSRQGDQGSNALPTGKGDLRVVRAGNQVDFYYQAPNGATDNSSWVLLDHNSLYVDRVGFGTDAVRVGLVTSGFSYPKPFVCTADQIEILATHGITADSDGSTSAGSAGGSDTSDSSTSGDVMTSGDGTTGSSDSGTTSGDSATTDGETTGTGSSDGGTRTGDIGYFPNDAWMYQDISTRSLHSESSAMTQWLQDHGSWGTGQIHIDFSIEVLEADVQTPYREFIKTSDFFPSACDDLLMPVPTNGALESESGYECTNDGDCHLIVVDKAQNRLYEMWRANIVGDHFYGGCLAAWDLSRIYPPEGRGDQCTSADAGGFPIAPLLFTADEVASGEINHAIRFILPNDRMRAGVYTRPGTHAGAPSGVSQAPVYGGLWRLKSSFDVESLPSEGAKVVARAMQKYGMVLADGGSIALTAQSDRFTQNKWDGLLGPLDLASVPVTAFEVVDTGANIDLTYDCVRTPEDFDDNSGSADNSAGSSDGDGSDGASSGGAPEISGLYDSFDTDGPLDATKWKTYKSVDTDRLEITQNNGRYYADLKGDTDPQQTLWYNGAEGRLDYKTLTGDFDFIVRNMGIDSGSDPSDYQFCGLMVWKSSINYEFAVVGNRGGTANTVEYKVTNNGTSRQSDIGYNALPTGKGDLRVVRSSDRVDFYYQEPNGSEWNLLDHDGLYAERMAFGTDDVQVGLVTYGYSYPTPFVCTADQVEITSGGSDSTDSTSSGSSDGTATSGTSTGDGSGATTTGDSTTGGNGTAGTTTGDTGEDTTGGDTTGGDTSSSPSATDSTILFVTQERLAAGTVFGTIYSNFSNHQTLSSKLERGGDLWIRYPDGSLRNLTEEAGYGDNIAVREPSVHWDGSKALFAMVVGTEASNYWQLYEVTGLGHNDTVYIAKVPYQDTNYNNFAPIYAATSSSYDSNEDIIFVSDKTYGGKLNYPARDEYDSAPTNTGLVRLNPNNGARTQLTHSPSGDFTPLIDDFGRLIFTRWDHLQRDQQNPGNSGGNNYFGNAVTYSSETSTTAVENNPVDNFPESLVETSTTNGHTFNHFLLWETNPLDGSNEVTVNHVGRSEFSLSYTEGSFKDDFDLSYISISQFSANDVQVRGPGGMYHPKEDPYQSGAFYITRAQEFAFCGDLLYFPAAPSINAEDVSLQQLTSAGCYRNPLPLTDGQLVAAHTLADFGIPKTGGIFRLRFIDDYSEGKSVAGNYLTSGINGVNGLQSELDPVEVRVRQRPTGMQSAAQATTLPAPEQAACEIAFGSTAACNVGMTQIRDYLTDNKLALVISRNVTARDRADRQQPYNLNIPGGISSITPDATNVYDISQMQFLQGNLVRGYSTYPGRRALAQPIDDSLNANSNSGTIALGLDGSAAAFVPAERAVTWQLLAPNGEPTVRERYWVSFSAGEIRVCTSCHGINKKDQLDRESPTNIPEAFINILNTWIIENP